MNPLFMRRAVELAAENVARGGGPFGAIVVREGEIVGEGANRVTAQNDPTAHAEVLAIRDACARLGAFQLDGCDLYTSCEPCPMCLGAIYWARPARVFYAATRYDAARAGFDDEFIYAEIARAPEVRRIPMTHLPAADALRPFETWQQATSRIRY